MRQSTSYSREIINPEIVTGFTDGKEPVIKALMYFDMFQYPLTAEEIRQFADRTIDERWLRKWLKQLLEDNAIFLYNGFYSIQNNPLLAYRRIQGNQYAERLLVKATKIGRFLYQFPFVLAIGISGSLSKNYADEKSDIDFFIITKANRVWIARTLMHLYKKLTFLTGRQHFYCMNYYIDEKALLLEDQNIFTAIELKTLLPVSGEKVMPLFFETNQWANQQLPACTNRLQPEKDKPASWFKKLMEWTGKGKPGDQLDDYLFHITQKRWKHKEEKGKRNKKGQPMGLITNKHFARSDPGAFQEKVLALYQQKISALKNLYK